MDHTFAQARAAQMPLCPNGCGPLHDPERTILACPVCRFSLLLRSEADYHLWQETLLGLHPEWTPERLLIHILATERQAMQENCLNCERQSDKARERWMRVLAMAEELFKEYESWQEEFEDSRIEADRLDQWLTQVHCRAA